MAGLFPLFLILIVNTVWAQTKSDGFTFSVTPRNIVDEVTERLTLDCRPSKSLETADVTAIMLDIIRQDATGSTFVARQRLATDVISDNRTSAEGYLRSEKDTKTSFLKVNISEPTVSEEGVYTCRYIYLDAQQEIQNLAIAVNVTAHTIPPPTVIKPEVQAPELSCDCKEIWDEINAIKAMLGNRRSRGNSSSSDECQVSFSAKFPGIRSVSIESEIVAPFSDVISNAGEAFDVRKSAFVAPCDGQYFFSLTIRSQQELDSGYVDGVIKVDGNEVARTSAFVDTPTRNYESATNGVVVSLIQGQEVNVQIKTTSYGNLRGEYYSIFSGFYISS